MFYGGQLAQAAILRSVTRRLASDLLPVLDAMGSEWSLGDDLWPLVTELSMPEAEPWGSMTLEEIWRRIQSEIGGPIFSEVGARRTIRWCAFGITWTVLFTNSYELALLGEELAATLQIVQADLAEVDLCVFPTSVEIEVALSNSGHPTFEEVPDNSRARWIVRIPETWLRPITLGSMREMDVLTVAATILGQCTALPFKPFREILESAFKGGLATKAFTIRPARELFARIHSKEAFIASKRTESNASATPQWFEIPTADELKWRDTPGPGYSTEKAAGFIRNRYENSIRPIRLTLPRLVKDSRTCALLMKLREEGLPEWQVLNIIASMVTNFRVRNDIGSSTDVELMQKTFAKWMLRDEKPDDPVAPLDLFTEEKLNFAKNVAIVTNLKIWGLVSNLRTPDFAAIRRFLDVRYRNSSDDVPHTGYFPDWK